MSESKRNEKNTRQDYPKTIVCKLLILVSYQNVSLQYRVSHQRLGHVHCFSWLADACGWHDSYWL